jgi:hypothetical protein
MDSLLLTVIIIILIAEFLNGFLDGEMDTIKFRPNESWFPNSVWWITSLWKDRNWFIKVPFSMFLDGWHFVKFLKEYSRSLSIVVIVVLTMDLSFYYLFASILLYAYRGIIWEITYS